MTHPSEGSSPTGLNVPYLGIPQSNPGQNWYRQRDPITRDYNNYQVLDRWSNLGTTTVFILTSKQNGVATWVAMTGAGSGLQTLTGDAGGAISPSLGNITLSGTANQIATSGSGSSIAFALSSTLVLPGTLTVAGTTNINVTGSAITTIGTGGTGAVRIGNATGNTAVTGSLTASTTLTATLGNITATNGNLSLAGAGNKLLIHATTAASDSVGTSAAMTAGTVTVSTTAVTASSKIFLTSNTPGGTAGILSAPTASIVAGTSFVINSSNAADTSTVNYVIIN
jgi:hypothetical protein